MRDGRAPRATGRKKKFVASWNRRPAGYPVGDKQQRRELQGFHPGLNRGRACAPDDVADLGIAPSRTRDQDDPTRVRPTIARSHAAAPRRSSPHRAATQAMVGIWYSRAAGVRGRPLRRERRSSRGSPGRGCGGQRKAPVSIHHGRGGADDGVEGDLRQQQQDQHAADPFLALRRGGSAAPIEPSRRRKGVPNAATGMMASMPIIATPSSPPAVRVAASASPEST